MKNLDKIIVKEKLYLILYVCKALFIRQSLGVGKDIIIIIKLIRFLNFAKYENQFNPCNSPRMIDAEIIVQNLSLTLIKV